MQYDKQMTRAATYEEIEPLKQLCKEGRFIEVQQWIAEGKPINPPKHRRKTTRKYCPLQISIEKGFHSLVQILLEAGAEMYDGQFNALSRAVKKRRPDIVELLVENGADVKSVSMRDVFESWDPKIIEYFINQGADVETGYPLSFALCDKIRTSLGIYRRFKKQFPSFQEQANIALRYHCREGSAKWVSLLLWAGADPYAKGPGSPFEEADPEEDICALEYAVLYNHDEIFDLKGIKLSPKIPVARELLVMSCYSRNSRFMIKLIDLGFTPLEHEDHGSSMIQSCICSLDWCDAWLSIHRRENKNLDSARSREKLQMIQILTKNGAKWLPKDINELNRARRTLLKMKSEYTYKLLKILVENDGTTKETIDGLLKTSTIQSHIVNHKTNIDRQLIKLDKE